MGGAASGSRRRGLRGVVGGPPDPSPVGGFGSSVAQGLAPGVDLAGRGGGPGGDASGGGSRLGWLLGRAGRNIWTGSISFLDGSTSLGRYGLRRVDGGPRATSASRLSSPGRCNDPEYIPGGRGDRVFVALHGLRSGDDPADDPAPGGAGLGFPASGLRGGVPHRCPDDRFGQCRHLSHHCCHLP